MSFILNTNSAGGDATQYSASDSPVELRLDSATNEKPTPFGNRQFVSTYMAPPVGFEPTTNALTGHCSTAELQGNVFLQDLVPKLSPCT